MAAITVIITTAGIQILGTSGTLTTLPLPTGVSLVPAQRAYAAMLNQNLVMTGNVSLPIWLQPNLTLSPLPIPKPGNAPTLATGAAGTYTGHRRVRISFVVKNPATRATVCEGPLSDPSSLISFVTQKQAITSIATCTTNSAVNCRRVYFTADNGTSYFQAVDIDDNTTTSFTVDIADASLDIVAATTTALTAPADLDQIVVWKDRLWGVSGLDNLVGSGSGRVDQWPVLIPVDPRGSDALGITGFLPRRDEMAVCRRNIIWKLTGSDETNYALVKLIEGKGCIAPASCIVVRDVGYFLSDDGIYKWDAQGVSCITDDSTRPWFTTDTYFNRAGFKNCFAGYDPVRNQLLWFLPVAGGTSTVLNRWVSLDVDSGEWFGPHVAAGLDFSCAVVAPDSNNILRLVLGASDSFLYYFQPGSHTDGSATAIDFDVHTKPHSGDSPDFTHVWLRPTIFTKQDVAGTLQVTPSIGDIGASAGTTLSHNLTKEREVLPRLGVGRLCSIRFRENTAGQGVELYGYEIPFSTLGRR